MDSMIQSINGLIDYGVNGLYLWINGFNRLWILWIYGFNGLL